MHSPILTIRGMNKVYREHLATFEARLPSLTLASGDILGITGPSGCGKSSLLELLALLSVPTSVQSFLFTAGGREYDIAALWRSAPGKFFHLRRQHMGFVHQAGGLMPFLTVHDNILLALQLAEHSKNAGQRARVDELIDFIDLGRVAEKLPEKLGQFFYGAFSLVWRNILHHSLQPQQLWTGILLRGCRYYDIPLSESSLYISKYPLMKSPL